MWGRGKREDGATERLANTHDMKIPQIIELMDMGENTHQKVSL